MKKKLRLILPNGQYVHSFARGIAEARKEKPTRLPSPFHSEFEFFKAPKDFPAYLSNRKDQRKGKNLKKGHVPQTVYWAMVGDKFVGVLKLRHKLWRDPNASHIGYAVIPSERGKGYATEMLRLGVRKARLLGIKKIIVSCAEKNIASRRVVEKNGGIFFKKIFQEGIFKLRFYIK